LPLLSLSVSSSLVDAGLKRCRSLAIWAWGWRWSLASDNTRNVCHSNRGGRHSRSRSRIAIGTRSRSTLWYCAAHRIIGISNHGALWGNVIVAGTPVRTSVEASLAILTNAFSVTANIPLLTLDVASSIHHTYLSRCWGWLLVGVWCRCAATWLWHWSVLATRNRGECADTGRQGSDGGWPSHRFSAHRFTAARFLWVHSQHAVVWYIHVLRAGFDA
jgi:hypothetical protein